MPSRDPSTGAQVDGDGAGSSSRPSDSASKQAPGGGEKAAVSRHDDLRYSTQHQGSQVLGPDNSKNWTNSKIMEWMGDQPEQANGYQP